MCECKDVCNIPYSVETRRGYFGETRWGGFIGVGSGRPTDHSRTGGAVTTDVVGPTPTVGGGSPVPRVPSHSSR